MLIGIDVGTTAIKAALFDTAGNVLKTFGAQYETKRPAPGHVEQNPEDWSRLVNVALSELATDRKNIAAIGLCSQVNTHVFVDENGQALLPAFTWQDGRCGEVAAALDAQVRPEDKLLWWGAPLPIDASHILARIAYVAKYYPDIWAKTRWVMAPKDYCQFHLTGEVATDPMTCFGIIDQSLQKISKLIDLVPSAAKRLPPIKGFTEVMGRTKSGSPMVTSAMDAWSGMIGTGVCSEGQAGYLSGTSEVIAIVSSQKVPTPGVIAFPPCEGITLHAGPTQSGGASVQWLSRLIGKSPQEISALVAEANTAQPLPLFLPHLEGERAPIWDIDARGAFTGLSSAMGPAELSRAVLEGVGYSAKWLLESLEKSSNQIPEIIHHSGGGAASDIWCQIRADILGKIITRTKSHDAGVVGAALMAGVGASLFSSLAKAADTFVQMDKTFTPNPDEKMRHEDRFQQYKLKYEKLK